MVNKKNIVIVGGGAAALGLASFLDATKFNITLCEKNKALGRKFLVAGKGGFNLTHAENIQNLKQRYTPVHFLDSALSGFTNVDFRNWLAAIKIPTFIGSSNRVYPKKGTKPIEVLKAMEKQMTNKGVEVKYGKNWRGWGEEHLVTFTDGTKIEADIIVFALGGGSWKITGSDGQWLKHFEEAGISTTSFQPSNCAFQIEWPKELVQRFAGFPLKNISISCSGKVQKGEVVLSKFGLEGNAIYALSPEIRHGLKNSIARISIDFKPQFSAEVVQQKLQSSPYKTRTDQLKRSLKLSSLQLALLRTYMNKADFLNDQTLAAQIKSFDLNITGVPNLNEAISTAGGVCLEEVNADFELKRKPNHYCIGEMLDWDAPTGGYLLQACFSMGYHLAQRLNIRQ